MCTHRITELPLTEPPSQTNPLCVRYCPGTMHARFSCLQALDPPSPWTLWLCLVDPLGSLSGACRMATMLIMACKWSKEWGMRNEGAHAFAALTARKQLGAWFALNSSYILPLQQAKKQTTLDFQQDIHNGNSFL